MSSDLKIKVAQAERELEEALQLRKQILQIIEEGSEEDKETYAPALEDTDKAVAEGEATLSKLKQQLAEVQAANAPKWNPADHPAFKDKIANNAVEKPVNKFKVNDIVEARWTDRAWYKAKITMITGSSAAPKYRINFTEYNDSATVESHDIRPLLNESKKRKADGAPVTPTVPAVPANPSVISAAATVDPELASQARQEPSKVSDGPPKPAKQARKVANKKHLESGKTKWNEFLKKGPAKPKDSMFRTGNALNARVGFTGSGAGMRRDATRGRHVYQAGGDEDTLG